MQRVYLAPAITGELFYRLPDFLVRFVMVIDHDKASSPFYCEEWNAAFAWQAILSFGGTGILPVISGQLISRPRGGPNNGDCFGLRPP
jgi:hypothetical protein